MELPARVTAEEFEALDDDAHGYYRAKGEEYVLQVQGIEQHPTVQALKNAHDRMKDRNDELSEKVKAFGDLTPDDVDELRSELEDLRESSGGDLISAEELKELKDRQKELAKKAKRAEELEQELEFRDKDQQKRLRNEVRGALAEAGVPKEAVPAGAALIMSEYDARYERGDDGFRPVVTGELNGVPGDHALTEFVGEWVDGDGAIFLPASGKGGSGAEPDSRPRSPGGVKTFDRNDPAAWGEHADEVVEGEAQAT